MATTANTSTFPFAKARTVSANLMNARKHRPDNVDEHVELRRELSAAKIAEVARRVLAADDVELTADHIERIVAVLKRGESK